MARRLSDIELERAKVLKATRAAVRLKHALAADAELNEVLPLVEQEFNDAVAQQKPYQLDVSSVFEDVQ